MEVEKNDSIDDTYSPETKAKLKVLQELSNRLASKMAEETGPTPMLKAATATATAKALAERVRQETLTHMAQVKAGNLDKDTAKLLKGEDMRLADILDNIAVENSKTIRELPLKAAGFKESIDELEKFFNDIVLKHERQKRMFPDAPHITSGGNGESKAPEAKLEASKIDSEVKQAVTRRTKKVGKKTSRKRKGNGA